MPQLSDPRDNNFNILRLVAASSVIFSHATHIVSNDIDLLKSTIGYSVGWVAVSAFFSISGMLIYLSVVRSQSVWNYVAARCLRIFPGLWFMLVVTTALLGVFFSTLPALQFFTDPETAGYIAGNAYLYAPKYSLPGVFETNPLSAINGSLWTLRFEFTCYILTLVCFLVGAYRSEQRFLLLCGVFALGYFGFLAFGFATNTLDSILYDGSDFAKMHRLCFAFFLGILMGRYIETFRPRGWMVLGSIVPCLLTFGTPFFATFLIIAIAMTLFWFAFLQHPWLVPFRSMPDYSYGIYIYAFPIQQALAYLMPGSDWLTNSLLSLLITLPFAAFSWHVIEKPALSLKPKTSMKRAVQ